jgi:hypothetical protein
LDVDYYVYRRFQAPAPPPLAFVKTPKIAINPHPVLFSQTHAGASALPPKAEINSEEFPIGYGIATTMLVLKIAEGSELVGTKIHIRCEREYIVTCNNCVNEDFPLQSEKRGVIINVGTIRESYPFTIKITHQNATPFDRTCYLYVSVQADNVRSIVASRLTIFNRWPHS